MDRGRVIKDFLKSIEVISVALIAVVCTIICAGSANAQGNDNLIPTDPNLNRVNWAAAVEGSIISGCNSNANFLIDSLGSGTGQYLDCAVPGGALLIDLGQSRSFDTVQLHLWDGDDRFYQYVISISEDGTNFTEVINRSEGEYRGIQRLVIPEQQARYIKFVGDPGSTYNWFQPIDEIHVIGTSESAPEANQQIVVDAVSNGGGSYTVGVKVNLNAGVYKISHLSGATSAWANDSGNGGKTWSGRTDVSVPHFNKSYQFGWVHTSLSTYATASQADAAMQGKSFTLQLPAQSDVYFWLNDGTPADNRGTHTVLVTQLSGPNDTLLERVRDSMTRSVLWQQDAVAYWSEWISNSNAANPSCFGCHIQSQAIDGLNASRNKLPSLPVDQPFMAKAAEVFLKWQNSSGWVSPYHGGSLAIAQTSLWAWSLSSYQNSQEAAFVLPGLFNALNWLKGQQTAAGGWNDDHGGGPIYGDGQPSAALTSGNIQALVKVLNQVTGEEFLPFSNIEINGGEITLNQHYGMVNDVVLNAEDVTGFRITISDVFTSSGNFVLSEIEAFASDGADLTISSATANLEQGGYPISESFNGISNDTSDGWAYGANVRTNPAIGFWKLNESIDSFGRIRITQIYPEHQWKVYKIEFTSDPNPTINSTFVPATISGVGILQPGEGTLGAALLTSLRAAAKMYLNPAWNYSRNTRTAAQTIIGVHQALAYLEPEDVAAAAPRMTEIANYLRSIQRPDGGWNDGSGVSRVYPSAMALRALLLLNPTDLDDVLLKGADYLLTTQRGDNAWASPPIGTNLAVTTWVEIALPTLFDVLSQDYLQSIVPDLTAYGLNGKVELLWTALSQAVSYNLFRKTAELPWTEIAHGYQSDIASYTDSNVVNEATYYYKVQWNSKEGVTSADSNQASATPYGMQCGGDSPPIITSPPVLGGVQDIPYQYEVEASDPDPGDILTYSLESKPSGMTINSQTGLISWLPTASQAGSHLVTIKVTDNIGRFAIQSYQVTVAAIYINYPPQFSTTPNSSAIAGELYSYPSHAIDPNGTDILTYELLIAPPGMTINSTTGKVKWTPSLDTPPDSTELVRLRVKDSASLTDEQEFTVSVGANTAPTITSSPPLTAPRLVVYIYDVEANDARNSTLNYSLQQKPSGMSIQPQSGFITWVPTLAQVGDHQVHVRVADPGGLVAEQSYIVTVPPNDPPYFVSAPKVTGAIGGGYYYDANAVDPEAQPLQFSVDLGPVGLTIDQSNGIVSWVPTEEQLGEHVVSLKVTDDFGLSALQNYTVNVGPVGSDGGGNQPFGDITVTINSPTYGSTISVKTELFATITSTTGPPDSWTATLLRPGTDFSLLLGTAPGGLTNQSIGFIDPSALANDPYLVEIAVTKGNSTGYYTFPYDVSSYLKLGEFSLKVSDLTIPLSGLPITIRRSYSTFDLGQYEFGAGWRLDVPGRVVDSADELLLEPYTTATRVFVTRPDGKRVGFTFAPYLVHPFFPFWVPAFTADPGVTDVLEVGQTVLFNSGGSFWELFGEFNPSTFYLTTKENVRYTIDEAAGLLEARDANFNTLTFTNGAIIHSSGAAINLERDSTGRVTKITDLNGEQILYAYDAAGDLLSVTNQLGEVTSYTYDPGAMPHLLKTITLDGGTKILENVYSPDGRLIKQIDGEGNETLTGINVDALTETIQDPNGNITTLKYDPNGNLVQKIAPNGKIWSYGYDGNFNLISEIDPLGQTITRVFDSSSRLLAETDARGFTKSFEYNSLGQVTKEINPFGKTKLWTYDDLGNILSTSDESGRTTQLTYDVSGNLLTITDPIGSTTSFERTPSGRASKISHPNGLVEDFEYSANGQVTKRSHIRTDSQGVQHSSSTLLEHDELGRTNKVIATNNESVTFERSPAGNVVGFTDQAGAVTNWNFNAANRLTSVIRSGGADGGVAGAGEQESYEYDGSGNFTKFTDPLGNVYQYHYNSLNQLIKITLPDQSTILATYDDLGRLVSETNQRGFSKSYQYDAVGNRTHETDALGRVTVSSFDALGNEISRTSPRGLTTYFQYNDSGELVKTTFPDGTFVTKTYDDLGRVITETDELGANKVYTYGSAGIVSASTDPLGATTQFQYDEVGNLLKWIDAAGRQTVTDYDDVTRPTKRTLPLGMSEHFTFGPSGGLTSYIDFNGQNFAFEYDGQGRPTKAIYPGGNFRQYQYSSYDDISSVNENGSILGYQRNAVGALTQITYPNGQAIVYGYDSAENRTSVSTPSGTVYYTYDAADQLTGISDPILGSVAITYDFDGNLIEMLFPNGLREVRTYDSRNRVTRIETRQVASGNIVEAIDYVYNALGDIVTISRSDNSIEQYDYDAGRKLTAETYISPQGQIESTTYQYDSVGNRVLAIVGGEPQSYLYDNNDRIVQSGLTVYEYNQNGNLIKETTEAGITQYGWDSDDRLVSVTAPDGSSIHTYNAEGWRTQSESNQSASSILYGIDPLVGNDEFDDEISQMLEISTGPGPARRLVHGPAGILAEISAAGPPQFVQRDLLGSARRVTDSSGNLVSELRYSAFGEIRSGDPASVTNLFAGSARDSNSGLYDMRARWYAGQNGRFVSRDSYEPEVDQFSDFNRYLYAGGNAVNWTDPTGYSVFAEYGNLVKNITSKQVLDAIKCVGWEITFNFVENGLYMYLLSDGTYYVGQSKKTKRRYGEHRRRSTKKWQAEIVEVLTIALPQDLFKRKRKKDEAEKYLIEKFKALLGDVSNPKKVLKNIGNPFKPPLTGKFSLC